MQLRPQPGPRDWPRRLPGGGRGAGGGAGGGAGRHVHPALDRAGHRGQAGLSAGYK